MDHYINAATALFYEIRAQMDDYVRDRFRTFFHSFIAREVEPLPTALELGVDYVVAHYTHTIPTCQLRIGIFGEPNDHLFSDAAELSETAKRSLEEVRRVRSTIATDSPSPAVLSLARGYELLPAQIVLYVGRRALGSAAHKAFREAAAAYLGPVDDPRPSSPDTHHLHLQSSELFEIRSFDSILDQAMRLVLQPFPFHNQDLLREILEATEDPQAVTLALDRLDRTPENAAIFERYLHNPRTSEHALAGSRDVEKLTMLTCGEDKWLAEVVRTRIAILQGDRNVVEAIAATPTVFHAVHMAIESIDDVATLRRIRAQITGDTPRDIGSRQLIDAKLAFHAGDGATIDRLLEGLQSFDDVRFALIRLKTALDVQRCAAPRVFVSYRHESDRHRGWVANLATDLRRNGIDALLDEWEIGLGDSIGDFAASAIFSAKAMLFLITETAVAAVEADDSTRSVLKFEFQLATARRYKDGNFRIIGLLRSGDRPPNHLADTLYLDFRNDVEYDDQLGRLVGNLLGRSDKPAVTVRPT